jgi:hypothetical protein
MMPSHQLTLLHIVRSGRDVGDLRRRGLEYHQIAILLQASIEASLLAWEDDRLVLTQKGNERLIQKKREGIGGGSSEWIEPDKESMIDKMNEDDIYLPKVMWKQ